MAIRLGNVQAIDLYSGSTPIDRVYLGQSKIYDAFAEISGNLPLTFNARRAENLNDYTIYGTVNGSGVKTNNLFSAKLEQGTLDPTGAVMDSDFRVRTSDFITLTNSPYFVLSGVGIRAQAMIYVYDNNGTYLRTLIGEWAAIPLTFSVSANEKIKIIFRKYDNTIIRPDYLPTCMITEGTTVPAIYTPFGYELPLKIESGAQSQDISIYICDSKLGEEEYVNFRERKVYKRTKNFVDKLWFNNDTQLSASSGLPAGHTGRIAIINPIDVSNLDAITLTYSLGTTTTGYFMYSIFSENTLIERVTGKISGSVIDVTKADTLYICLYAGGEYITVNDVQWIMLNRGSIPFPYEPYLTPTDPPVPLQPIPTYKGENSLSSTETLGNVTIKGRLN